MKDIIILLGLVCITALSVPAQSLTDEQRRRLEQEIQQLSPAEIEMRLRQSGVSREEAIRRARLEGLSLEKYLFPDLPAVEDTLRHEDRLAPLLPEASLPETIDRGVLDTLRYRPKEFADRTNAMELDGFGYSIFKLPPTTFEPVLHIAAPSNYRLGAGDELVISVWGEVQVYHALTINRDGYVLIPDVGRVIAAGSTLEELRNRLLNRMMQVYSSLAGGASEARSYLDVSIGKLRTIQVFVLGDVVRPGGYTISSLSTAFTGLYLAGGPNLDGSLRSIRVLRQHDTAAEIDFYQYALKGDQTNDIRLEDGDIVFVPPVGRRIAISGSVLRPAIYELLEGETLGDLITMAGGLRFNAYIDRLHIERIIPFTQRHMYRYNMLDLDVRFQDVEEIYSSGFPLEAGDVVSVFSRPQFPENRIRVTGSVFKPGIYELTGEMRISDLIHNAGGLLDGTFTGRGTLVRTREEDLRREILRFDVESALAGESEHNLRLKRLDEVFIYSKDFFFPEQVVTVSGEVRNPGTYTRVENMTVEDLLVLAGGTTEEAMLHEITVARLDSTSERVYTEKFTVPVDDNYLDANNNPAQPFFLIDFDHVKVPPDPRKNKQRYVDITGEVMYPGRFAILTDQDRLSDVLARAGGLRVNAYIEGARYFRDMDGDRLVPVSFKDALMSYTSDDNLVLRDGDRIIIPRNPQVVIVRGAVNVPSAVLYEKGRSVSDYINQAGGFKELADKSRMTVTLPSGRMWKASGWFFIPDDDVLAGSIINVPEKIPKEGRAMEILRDWSVLMASLAAIIVSIVQVTR